MVNRSSALMKKINKIDNQMGNFKRVGNYQEETRASTRNEQNS
jgi:hypothetical protein